MTYFTLLGICNVSVSSASTLSSIGTVVDVWVNDTAAQFTKEIVYVIYPSSQSNALYVCPNNQTFIELFKC